MKRHIKNYFEHYGYAVQEEVMCEICHSPAQDIHHIEFGRYKRSDEVENLIALCRPHHQDAHANKLTRQHLKEIHGNNLS